MRWLKLTILSLLWSFFFVSAVLVHVWISLLRLPRRWAIIGRLTKNFDTLVRRLLNIRIRLEGDRDWSDSGGQLIVSNHLGYVDGIVLGSIFPLIYVSKREVRRWRLIGQWSVLIGTIFIDRQRKVKILQLVEEITRKLREGANVLLFPEGTSTNGETLLPFQSAPFAAALKARAIVLPVTLTYRRIDEQPLSEANRDRVYWYSGMDFMSHLWNLLGVRQIEVSVQVHPAIEISHFQNNSQGRKKLGQACYHAIAGESTLGDLGGTSKPFQKLYTKEGES